NLLPAGQLDGGHIARGLLGKNAKFLSIATVIVLFVLGVMFYTGWLLFAFLIAFLGFTHPAPLNDISKLDAKRITVGAFGIMILVSSFVFVPLYVVPNLATFDLEVQGSNDTVAAAGGSALFYIYLENTGTMNITVQMDVLDLPENWSALIYVGNSNSDASGSLSLTVPFDSSVTVALEVLVPEGQAPGDFGFVMSATSDADNASETTQVTQGFMVHVS
ncbi:MAG: hypothetical protein LUQ16_05630, partial [Methanomassiliicoccales archaeon]|nr:hypothetical protein [Methanomassiliicoccales archaeon]